MTVRKKVCSLSTTRPVFHTGRFEVDGCVVGDVALGNTICRRAKGTQVPEFTVRPSQKATVLFPLPRHSVLFHSLSTFIRMVHIPP